MALAPAGGLAEMYDVLAPPVGVVAVSDEDVDGFDESPLEVGVALLDHVSVVGSAGAGAELGDEAAVAGEVLGGREAVDGAELTINDDGQDLGWSRHGLGALDGWCGLDAREDPVFQPLDMVSRASRIWICWRTQRPVSSGNCCSVASSSGRHLAAKLSLAVSRERAYLARVEWMQFFPKDIGTM